MEAVAHNLTRFIVREEVRALSPVRLRAGERAVIVARNSDAPLFFRLHNR